ncbi:hypothetical protein IPC600_22825 [Pseudomonas aeruginosa]|uniref:Uncharacterized protein n=1 Tax=Pseudomonas aeruginosa TaxID=287 RepID=A0A241XEF9_PSEAI|nr:hypothetical protein F8132_08795 [Pseudomonas aeruginosa]MCO1967429.1 hypothetical protein [Pseudomonas aeruginosa]MCO1986370.1 hypothetical protein [Pseudomonas aeruginosa]MCO2102809.1 hypothetical protein [Pseudomonas aeruginosa]MCO2430424.1 hypothetical protein [Pseudomonas aeruginosa]
MPAGPFGATKASFDLLLLRGQRFGESHLQRWIASGRLICDGDGQLDELVITQAAEVQLIHG